MIVIFEIYGFYFWYVLDVWNYDNFIKSFLEYIIKENKDF